MGVSCVQSTGNFFASSSVISMKCGCGPPLRREDRHCANDGEIRSGGPSRACNRIDSRIIKLICPLAISVLLGGANDRNGSTCLRLLRSQRPAYREKDKRPRPFRGWDEVPPLDGPSKNSIMSNSMGRQHRNCSGRAESISQAMRSRTSHNAIHKCHDFAAAPTSTREAAGGGEMVILSIRSGIMRVLRNSKPHASHENESATSQNTSSLVVLKLAHTDHFLPPPWMRDEFRNTPIMPSHFRTHRQINSLFAEAAARIEEAQFRNRAD